MCEGFATVSVQVPLDLCPQKDVGAVNVYNQGSRPAMTVSRLLKAKCFKIGVQHSSMNFQATAQLSSAGTA